LFTAHGLHWIEPGSLAGWVEPIALAERAVCHLRQSLQNQRGWPTIWDDTILRKYILWAVYPILFVITILGVAWIWYILTRSSKEEHNERAAKIAESKDHANFYIWLLRCLSRWTSLFNCKF